MTESTPWKADVLSSTQPVIYAYHALLHAGVLLQPIIPGKASELLDRLGIPAADRTLDSLHWNPDTVDVRRIRERLQGNKAGPLFTPIKKTASTSRTSRK